MITSQCKARSLRTQHNTRCTLDVDDCMHVSAKMVSITHVVPRQSKIVSCIDVDVHVLHTHMHAASMYLSYKKTRFSRAGAKRNKRARDFKLTSSHTFIADYTKGPNIRFLGPIALLVSMSHRNNAHQNPTMK